jgi:hypothetical protein
MSLWTRLFGRRSAVTAADGALPSVDTLVEDPRLSATRLGGTPKVAPWSAARVAGILQNFESNPSQVSLVEARLARQCLAQFWLVAPVDQLESLYRSAIGESYRVLLAGRLPREPLLHEERVWRDSLSQRLMSAFERPETTNVLLAAMAYFAPGTMRVADPLRQVPVWLQEDYARLFDPQLLQQVWRPAALIAPAGQGYGQAPSLRMTTMPEPAAAPPTTAPVQAPHQVELKFPRLSPQGGNEALAIVQTADFQTKTNGLINLHVIDPEDGEVNQQLASLRRLLGQIWLDAPSAQLEEVYRSSVGDLYRALLASGFSSRALNDEDRQLRQQLARFVADMSQPGAINALMAVLPFYAPGKIAFGGGEQHMPVWLVREISSIYGQPQSSGSAAIT